MVQLTKDLFHNPIFVGVLALAACLLFYYMKDQTRRFKSLIRFTHIGLFAGAASVFILSALVRIYNPQVWDFTAFYLFGKVAASGYNYYSPEAFHTVLNSISIPFNENELGGFYKEVVNVGFPYPPPTILYFMPLGFFSYSTALTLWTAINLLVVFACIYLMYELFLRQYKLNGLILITILTFIFGPALSTISFSQTNFFILLWLLLAYKYSDKPISGLFIALAIYTKPYMAIFVIYFLIRKQWKQFFTCCVSGIGILLFSVLLVGTEPLISYIIDNPSRRIPAMMYTEEINQSLMAVLLRANIISLDNPQIYFLIFGLIIAITGVFIFYLLRKKYYNHLWAILLLVGLLIYPGTLIYYGTLLLFIIAQLFDHHSSLFTDKRTLIPLLTLFYVVSTVSIFATILLLIAFVIIHSFDLLKSRLN